MTRHYKTNDKELKGKPSESPRVFAIKLWMKRKKDLSTLGDQRMNDEISHATYFNMLNRYAGSEYCLNMLLGKHPDTFEKWLVLTLNEYERLYEIFNLDIRDQESVCKFHSLCGKINDLNMVLSAWNNPLVSLNLS